MRTPLLVAAATGVAVAAAVTGMLSYLLAGQAGVFWVAVAATALLAVVLRARWTTPRAVTPADRSDPVAGPGRFADYEQLVSQLNSARQDHRYFDRALRPLLRQTATAIFADRHGVSGDDVGDAVGLAERLGPEVWRLLDPERPPWEDPPDGRRAGPTVAQLSRIIDRIESL